MINSMGNTIGQRYGSLGPSVPGSINGADGFNYSDAYLQYAKQMAAMAGNPFAQQKGQGMLDMSGTGVGDPNDFSNFMKAKAQMLAKPQPQAQVSRMQQPTNTFP